MRSIFAVPSHQATAARFTAVAQPILGNRHLGRCIVLSHNQNAGGIHEGKKPLTSLSQSHASSTPEDGVPATATSRRLRNRILLGNALAWVGIILAAICLLA